MTATEDGEGWRMDIGNDNDASFRLPRSSAEAMNHWCTTPLYSCRLTTKPQPQGQQRASWTSPRKSVHITAFVPCASSWSIELAVHDPQLGSSSAFQVSTSGDVTRIKLLALSAIATQQHHEQNENERNGNDNADNQHDIVVDSAGLLLIFTTSKGLSIFPIVLTRTAPSIAFILSECITVVGAGDLDEGNACSLQLEGRRITAMECMVTSDHEKAQAVVLASSLPQPSASSPGKTNVDAVVVSLKDHICPVFRFSGSSHEEPSAREFCLLSNATSVKKMSICGGSIDRIVVAVILTSGEMFVLSLDKAPSQHQEERGSRRQLQSIYIHGNSAHPSLTHLGAPMLVSAYQESNKSSFAILCKPKVDEIGFKPSIDAGLLSARKSVSISPIEHTKVLSPFISNSIHSTYHVQPASRETPARPPKCVSWRDSPAGLSLGRHNQATNQTHIAVDSALFPLNPSTITPLARNTNGRQTPPSQINAENEMSATTTASPLIGLGILDGESLTIGTRPENETQTEDPGVVDLTGRWPAKVQEVPTTPAITIDLASEFAFASDEPGALQNLHLGNTRADEKETKSHVVKSPNVINSPFSFNLNTADMMVKRNSVTPPVATHSEDNTDHDRFAHLLVVTVERVVTRTGSREEIDAQGFRIGHTVSVLPSPLAKFTSASLTWALSSSANFSRPHDSIPSAFESHPQNIASEVYVATHRSSVNPTKLNFAKLSAQQNRVEISGVRSYDLRTLIKSSLAFSDYDFKIKSIALESKNAFADLGNNQTSSLVGNDFAIRMLLASPEHGGRDKSFDTLSGAPINISANESVRLAVSSLTLPSPAEQLETKGVVHNPGADVKGKMDEMMNFLRQFEDHVNNRLDSIENLLKSNATRVDVLEQAMRSF